MERDDDGLDVPEREKLAALRYRVAGMIKNLVAARAKVDPEWCKKNNIDGIWFSSTKRPQKAPLARLLSSAAAARGLIIDEFYGGQNSIADAHSDDVNQGANVEKLMDLLCQFVERGELLSLADKPKLATSINWDRIANWDLLPKLRKILDKLPEPAQVESRLSGNSQVQFGRISINVNLPGPKCPRRVRALLEFLSQKRGYSCDMGELADAIWRDPRTNVTETKADDVLKVTRRWFKICSIKLNVTRDERLIQVVELSSEPAA